MQSRHEPVLLEEVLKIFEGRELKVFFEGTVGAGGHARAILKTHPEIEHYIACDRDRGALDLAKQALASWGKKVEFRHGSYAEEIRSTEEIDGFFLDIGVSSMQLDEKERGFSFSGDGPLDMRMDPEGDVTAKELVNGLPEKELAQIFYEYGEERRSRQVAKAIVIARKKKRIETTGELAAIVKSVVRGGKIHPATRVFQALRIAVNDELGQLERGLQEGIRQLRSEGRLAVISFHSLEDRIVKWQLKQDERVKILTKKPITPTREEARRNPRARSAKLRAAEKLN